MDPVGVPGQSKEEMPRALALQAVRQFQTAEAPVGVIKKAAADKKATEAIEVNRMTLALFRRGIIYNIRLRTT
jgi:hypothetical protein